MKLKKIFALLLCASMLLSVLPMGALAGLLSVGEAPAQEESAGGGFLTVDGEEPVQNGNGGFLTVDGKEPGADGNGGFLTVEGGDEDEDEEPRREPVPGPVTEVFICEWCGWADGYHADNCPSKADEEEPVAPAEQEEPAAKPDKSQVRAYAPAANTYGDIFEALLAAETLEEFEDILSQLDEAQQAELYDLLDEDELEALAEAEAALAYAAVESFALRDTSRTTVSLDVAVQSMNEAIRAAMQELADGLGSYIASMLGRDRITLRAFALPEERCTAVEAFAARSEEHAYQWQILAGEDADGAKLWVDIRGAEEKQLLVTYAMVASLLDGNDQVQLRCVIDGEATQQVITATVDYTYRQVWDAGELVEEENSDEEENFDEEISPFALMGAAMTLDDGEVAVQDAASDVKKTYNIVINYKFENNEIVADPYTASLAEGSSFSATVTFPTVQGYLPYVGETQQNSIELNYTSVSEDVTINVVYKPTNVNYTVIHYQQNVDNDQYTEVARETKQGLTGSQVPEVAKEYEGFYSLLYERPNIAADSSTVIEVYYDRYYYLMNFDMDGGYGTDPIYARYGAPVGTVNAPTKAGYSFKGWAETKGGTTAVTLPTTMPAANKTYYAIWEANDTAKVTIVFWGENADDEGYSYLADQTKVINLKPGKEFTYSESEMLECDEEVHTHTDDCIGCGKTEHTHSAVGGSCYTLTCTVDTHTHGTGCYAGVGTVNASHASAPNNPQNGQVYHSDGFLWVSAYTIIYINGTWYNYTGSTASGSIAPTTCGKTESTHTHNNDCYTLSCTTEVHTHEQKCYNCGKEQHTHNSDCYMQGAGLDSTLWKFVKSDTITVAADGSSVINVYYDRTEFTLTFRDGNQTVKTLTEKWGADIAEHWPVVGTNGTTYNNGERWRPSGSSTYREVLVYLRIMPAESFTLTVSRVNYDTYYMHYMVEALPGATGTTNYNGTTYVERFSVTANYNFVTRAEDFFDLDGFTQKESNPTFDNSGGIDIRNGGDVYFYYTRNSYKLTFNDQYNDVKNETVKFEAPLSTYKDYVPEVPSAYEPGSVEFGGWYQNPQCTGEEYKLEEHEMPASDLILYAKWVPVNRTVKFYLTETSTEVYKPTTAETAASFTIPHGDNIAEEYVKNHLEKSAMNEAKPNGDYTFVMWYYYEDGVKKPFDPTTQIREDLTLYGEWSSNTLKEYTVQYVLKDDHSVKVAADLTGSGLAGTTKTFDAKGGTELYAAYQEGYFPTVQSQSLLLDIESNSLVVTFEYVPMPAVPYTVKYVEKDTGKSLADDKVVSDNRKAVVTETFVPISGYMPDAYQKRLIVTAGGENVLYFYYTKDTKHALYIIKHFTQNTDGATWTEYASSTATGDIGTRYTASTVTIPGYTYDHIEYVVNGTKVTDVTAEGAKLTENGLEINLYYVRNEYPYQVRYLEQGSGKKLQEPKNGTGKYGQVISESAIDIDGYEVVGNASQTLNIRIDEGEGAPKLNIITFYYKEKEVTIKYVAVGPEGVTNFGSVSPESETLKVKSGTAQGSTPTAGDGFKFVGWYKDEACTQPVDTTWVDASNKIVPQKTDGKNVAATYYAKFEHNVTSLTITKKWNSSADYYQDAVFTVSNGTNSIKVVIHPDKTKTNGENSVTINGLKVGSEYTVTEDTDWAWRYTSTITVNGESASSITLNEDKSKNTVTVTNTLKTDGGNKWLDFTINKENVFEEVEGN